MRLKRVGVNPVHCIIKKVDEGNDGDYVLKLEARASAYLNGTALPSTPSKTPKLKTLKVSTNQRRFHFFLTLVIFSTKTC